MGEGSDYSDLLPWFLLYGLGGGLLLPAHERGHRGVAATGRAGVASGMLNVSREVFGLLGITILGAILSNRRARRRPARHCTGSSSGYQFSLVVAAIVIAAGAPMAWITLRAARPTTPAELPEPVLEPV